MDCLPGSPALSLGGSIMLLAFWLFRGEMIHIVSITFTALILTELLMVALTIRTWHWMMLLAQLFSLAVYVVSLAVLQDYFGKRGFDGGIDLACTILLAMHWCNSRQIRYMYVFICSRSIHAAV